ncbi:DUF6087 family protein [Streptomyces sp. S1]|uniref:DUF6087 family protein n=1 Tax=Streptomyces sp. S1 TaxID=718288 RepID=UPI003D71DBEC
MTEWPQAQLLRHDAAIRDEEPLEDWARRRDERRAKTKGRLRAVPLGEGPYRGAHVDPDAPRAIQQWTGTQWEPVGVVDDLAAAQALLFPLQPVEKLRVGWDRPVLGKGRGRHRKPSPVE